MKKCFDNVKLLDLARMKDRWEAMAMNSAEGEKVDFKGIVRLEGPVEVCRQLSVCVCVCVCVCV